MSKEFPIQTAKWLVIHRPNHLSEAEVFHEFYTEQEAKHCAHDMAGREPHARWSVAEIKGDIVAKPIAYTDA